MEGIITIDLASQIRSVSATCIYCNNWITTAGEWSVIIVLITCIFFI